MSLSLLRSVPFLILGFLVIAVVTLVSRASAVPNDVTADFVLGQPNFTTSGCGFATASSLCVPSGVAVDNNGNVYVADANNNRVLEYDNPLNTDAVADRVFGQGGSFTTKACNLGGISALSLCYPLDVAIDSANNLYVVDFVNNRVLEYFTPISSDTVADRVWGQNGLFTTQTYPNNPTADTLNNPAAVGVDNAGNVYILDRGRHRVLQYDPPTTNNTADRVFGQLGSFTTGVVNKGGLSADSLAYPNSLGVDGAGNLYVADADNWRGLMFKKPVALDTTADVVFGQLGSFTTAAPNNGGVNADTLEYPTDIAADAVGNVYITDTGTERTLLYDQPDIFGTTADVVFGQGGSFTAFGQNTSGISASSYGDPWSIDFDQLCNTWIVDLGNQRVLEYDKPPNACVESTAPTPTGAAPTAPVLQTAPGVLVTVSLNGGTAHTRGIDITFESVDAGGITSVTMSDSGPPPPPGHEVTGAHGHGTVATLSPVLPIYYDITTTAMISGTHHVCIRYDDEVITPGNVVKLMHYDGGTWDDITSAPGLVGGPIVCGDTDHFSPFAVMQAPPGPIGGVVDLPASDVDTGEHAKPWALVAVVSLAAAAALGGLQFARRRDYT